MTECRAAPVSLICAILHSTAVDCGSVVGSVATYQCNRFTLSGDSLRCCQDINGVGDWSGATPFCIGIRLHMQKMVVRCVNTSPLNSFS